MNSFRVNRSNSILCYFQHVLKYVETVLVDVRQFVCDDILSELMLLRNIKLYIACRVSFVKLVVDGDTGLTTMAVFHGLRRT